MIRTGVVSLRVMVPQGLVERLAVRARGGGRSVECEVRLALEHWLVWQHDQGEMRSAVDRDDDFGGVLGLPRPEELT